YLANRIDTREWQIIEDKENNRILFQNTSELPEDLKQDQQTFIEQHDFDNTIIGLNLWARELFEKKEFKKEYFSSYEAGLEAAKQLLNDLQDNRVSNHLSLAEEAIKNVAAVCIRDIIQDLSSDDIKWCLEIIVNAVVELPNFLEIPFKYNLPPFGNGACAYIL